MWDITKRMVLDFMTQDGTGTSRNVGKEWNCTPRSIPEEISVCELWCL